jgi:hypothetical protein
MGGLAGRWVRGWAGGQCEYFPFDRVDTNICVFNAEKYQQVRFQPEGIAHKTKTMDKAARLAMLPDYESSVFGGWLIS